MKSVFILIMVGVAMGISSIEATAAETWTFCATEWGTCSFSGTAQVRYGANGKYVTKTFTRGTPCTNAVFGDPIFGVVKSCEYLPTTTTTTPTPAPTPTPTPTAGTWTFCAKEWGTCSFSGMAQVRYGANGKYVTKTFTRGTPCTNAVFGDPIFGVVKSCEYLPPTTTTTPTPAPSGGVISMPAIPLPACTKTIGPSDNINANIGGAGSVLCLLSGTYNQTIAINNSGTAASPIVVRAAPGALPIIDGQNSLPRDQYTPMVGFNGNYGWVDGLEIRNSAGRGVTLLGTFNRISRSKVHDIYNEGIFATGDDNIVEYNEVYEAVLMNKNKNPSGWATGISSARDIRGNKITERTIIRGNISHDNWGEGIDSYESDGTLIEGNISYNNWSVNLYVSDSPNTIVRNNLVYKVNPTGGRGGNLTIADEVASKPRTSNVVVTNNIVYGTTLCEVCWTIVEGLRNINVHHNTIVNGSLEIDAGNGTGIVESANCIISASQVPGLGTVTPGSLTPQKFANANCPAGRGADVSKF